jgi:hypothetical protein
MATVENAALEPWAVTRPLVFAVSLLVLLVAHQVGDHVLQTDRQAATKATRGRGAVRAMAGHLIGYHVAAAVLVVGTVKALGLPLTASGVGAGLLFSAITHSVLDLRWPVRALLRATGSPKFAEATAPVCGMYTADQALHQLCLLISALLIATL